MKSNNLFFRFSSISILVHLDLNIIIISVSCGVIYVMLQLTVSPAFSPKRSTHSSFTTHFTKFRSSRVLLLIGHKQIVYRQWTSPTGLQTDVLKPLDEHFDCFYLLYKNLLLYNGSAQEFAIFSGPVAIAIVYVQTMNLKKVPSNAVFGSWVAHRLVVHL